MTNYSYPRKNVYKGKRYVPKVMGAWDSTGNTQYESLSIVTYQGDSYTSKQDVPRGVVITDNLYWVRSAIYNAQLEIYRQEVLNTKLEIENARGNFISLDDRLDTFDASTGGISASITSIHNDITNVNNDINDIETEITNSKGSEITLKNKLNKMLYLSSDFNLLGNGTDESQKIIDMFNVLPNGSTINFLKTNSFYGVTKGVTLTNRSNIKIISQGAEIKYLDNTIDVSYSSHPDYGKDSIFRLINTDAISFDGIKLNGNISNRTALTGIESFNSNITVLGCNNTKITNCVITEGMTDGIIISKDVLGVLSKNTVIKGNTIDKCRRNNLSLVAQDGVIVSNNILDFGGIIQGINPKGNLDIEPEALGESKNILVSNNTISNSQGQYACSCGGKGTDNLKILGNLFENNLQYALNLNSTVGFVSSSVKVESNTFKNNAQQPSLRIIGKNCDIVNKNIFTGNLYGVQLANSDGLIISNNKFTGNLYGGISGSTITNLKVSSNVFEDNSSLVGETNLVGYCMNVSPMNIDSIIQFNDNLVYTNSSSMYKQRGAKISASCNGFANGNVFKNLFNNIQQLQSFKYMSGNMSIDGQDLYQNIVSNMNFTGGGGNLYVGDKKHGYGTTIPTTGIWNKGDIVYNTTPFATGYMGWTCVTSGDFSATPPIFKGFGLIQA